MLEGIIDRARAHLRAHHSGELQFDEHLRALRFIIAPDGRLVAPVMVAMIEAAETVLFIPHADDEAMQMQVTLEPFREQGQWGALADRWRIHHGEELDVNWAFLNIDAARFEDAVIDGLALTVPNPLAADEPRLCRAVNEGLRDALRAVLRQRLSIDVQEPLMVAVDPGGVDIRGSFEVFRLTFDTPAPTAVAAEMKIRAMLGGAV